ncbi:MAG: kynureninase [Bacteroidetes bacterium]|nr:kynureninase [Bacteroidota bacterium]
MQLTLDYARKKDSEDVLASFRKEFHIPVSNGKPSLYFCGNSLGLQPVNTKTYINRELEKWAELGVEGHFKTDTPWLNYQEDLKRITGTLVGASPSEIVIMNTLTVNIHMLLISFYKPTKTRFKILCEAGSFPSDLYALKSHARLHGFDPKDVVVEIKPKTGEHLIDIENILETIELHKNELALIWMGGMNYYTGQLFDMEKITKAGQDTGALVGFDLAHAAGNVSLELNKWNVDFATWCTYKYMNSGPGGIGAAYINEKHGSDPTVFRFAGWWGNKPETRFLMRDEFEPADGAAGWQVSTGQILVMAPLKASLDLFEKAGFARMRDKSIELTNFLQSCIESIAEKFKGINKVQIITPLKIEQRGAQLSISFGKHGKEIFTKLIEQGVIVDWREPAVIRIAPAPLYNSFEEVYRLSEVLENIMHAVHETHVNPEKIKMESVH